MFGPAFDENIMREALLLQNHVIYNLSAEYNGTKVTLGNICFKPLAPDYEECAVQSVFQYFQVIWRLGFKRWRLVAMVAEICDWLGFWIYLCGF